MNAPVTASSADRESVVQPLLRVQGLSKRFGGVQALDRVDFEVAAGEVHALLGENGAGKSTLVKIITGVEQPDAGGILYGGVPVSFDNPRSAQQQGISVIHQEFNLLPNLSVGQNIYLGREPRKGWRVDWPALYRQAQDDLARLGLGEIDARAPLTSLDVGEQQMVAIVRALSTQARLLFLDEPTAALNERETERLFEMLRHLRRSGVGVVYISHRLQEIERIADRATVLRDGHLVGTVPVASTPLAEIVRMMVGRVLEEEQHQVRPQRAAGPVVLETQALTEDGLFRDVSIAVHAGEVVGLAGLMGAGQEAVARSLFGISRGARGEVRLFGGPPVLLKNPAQAIRRGLAFLPPDRKRAGLCLDLPIRENLTHVILPRIARWGFVRAAQERAAAKPFLRDLRVAYRSPDQPVGQLSGGNQQKIALARWLSTRARLYVLLEPTRGVDVGTKAEIHALIDRLAAEGAAILLVTSDLPETTILADRVYVLRHGEVVAELQRSRGEITQERILGLAAAGEAVHAA